MFCCEIPFGWSEQKLDMGIYVFELSPTMCVLLGPLVCVGMFDCNKTVCRSFFAHLKSCLV